MTSEHVIGRYALYDKIAAGGMATVYYGRLLGPVSFSRAVAIKQLHPQYARDHEFVSMFVDEARLSARIRHPNVVPVLDIVKHGRELYIVMEYVLGVSLGELLKRTRQQGERIPDAIASSIVAGCLHGLHAAHETRDERGELLGIVHRDVSPSNVLVGKDGMARVLDFGIAKAVGRAQVTRHGEIKGKVGYMAPEQLRGGDVSRAADIYACAVTLWEALTGLRAYAGDDAQAIMDARLDGLTLEAPSRVAHGLEAFDAIVLRGTAFEPDARWPSARDMAMALERGVALASHAEVADWVEHTVGEIVERRAAVLAQLEVGADASEVRAAIRADLSLDEPSISVQTWTGSSMDLAELYDDVSDDAARDKSADDTTREVPAARRANAEASAADARDLTPTKVDAHSAKAPRPTETTSPEAGERTEPLADSAHDGTTREVLEPIDDDEEPWQHALARASAARPVVAPPRRPPAMPSRLLLGGAGAVLVGGVVALALWGGAAAPPAASDDGRRVDPSETGGAQAASSHQALPSPEPAPSAVATPSPPSPRKPGPTEGDKQSPTPSATPRPAPSAAASTTASAAVPAPGKADPFDKLGGRH